MRDYTVADARDVVAGVVRYEVVPLDGDAVPHWKSGSHLDVTVIDGVVRQYSLLPAGRGRLAFAIKDRGPGSVARAVQRELHVGAGIRLGEPRAAFGLEVAPAYHFVAAGIGVTPIYSMIDQLVQSRPEVPWELTYLVRDRAEAAFWGELQDLAAASRGSVRLRETASEGRPAAAELLDVAPAGLVYACGPAGLLEELTARATAAGLRPHLRTEGFNTGGPGPKDAPAVNEPILPEKFRVVLARTGTTIEIDRTVTLVDALHAAGVRVPTSCRRGICGTCEVPVKSGLVDHLDDVLSPEERQAGRFMMPCVSRPAAENLVLDL